MICLGMDIIQRKLTGIMSHELFHLGIKALISNPSGKILLLQVKLKEISEYDGITYWDLPGGRVEKNESVIETLDRELHEETGLELRQKPVTFIGSALTKIRIHSVHGEVGLILFVYKCQWDNTPEIYLSEEHIAYQWVSLKQAVEALSVNYPPEFVEVVKNM